jgi:hypothetical protein
MSETKGPYYEIAIRAFYTTEDGISAVPRARLVVSKSYVDDVPGLKALAGVVDDALSGMPELDKFRPMTSAEIKEYCDDEDDE